MSEKEFGEYIRGLRKQKGLTTSELAKASSISQSYISQIETGSRGIPTDEVLLKLSRGLGVEYAELINMTGQDRSPFDSHIRHFTHLLLSEHPFSESIKSEFYKRAGEVIAKHGIKSNKTINLSYGKVKGMDRETHLESRINQTVDVLLDSDNVQYKFDLLQELQDIAHKYHLWFNPAFEVGAKQLHPDKLEEIIKHDHITYKGHPLTDEDRKFIIDMLDRMFPERKE